MENTNWKVIRDVDPDAKNQCLDEKTYQLRHQISYKVIELKNKYLTLLQKEKDKEEFKAFNNKYFEFESDYKNADLSKQTRIKKHEATLEMLRHKYELAVEKEMNEFESAMKYWDSQKTCFENKMKQEKMKQENLLLPPVVKQAKREYEETLKQYPYKYKPLDMFIEPPSDYIQYICLPAPKSEGEMENENLFKTFMDLEKEQEAKEREKYELAREKAEQDLRVSLLLEEQRQNEKRKEEPVKPNKKPRKEERQTTPPPPPPKPTPLTVSSNMYDSEDYTNEELFEFMETEIDGILHSRSEVKVKRHEKTIEELEDALLKKGVTQSEIQQFKKETRHNLSQNLQSMLDNNKKDIDEATVLQSRKAFINSLRTNEPPPITSKPAIKKKPKREEHLERNAHLYAPPV